MAKETNAPPADERTNLQKFRDKAGKSPEGYHEYHEKAIAEVRAESAKAIKKKTEQKKRRI